MPIRRTSLNALSGIGGVQTEIITAVTNFISNYAS